MSVEALKLDNVKKNFAGTEIIRGLNLSVAARMKGMLLLAQMEQVSPPLIIL